MAGVLGKGIWESGIKEASGLDHWTLVPNVPDLAVTLSLKVIGVF